MIADRRAIEKALREAEIEAARRQAAGEPCPAEFLQLIERTRAELRREHWNYHRSALIWWKRAACFRCGPEGVAIALWRHGEGLFVLVRHMLKFGASRALKEGA